MGGRGNNSDEEGVDRMHQCSNTWLVQKNLEKIAGIWGNVVDFDPATRSMEAFATSRILIDRTFFLSISSWVCFNMGGVVYNVYVKEVGSMELV